MVVTAKLSLPLNYNVFAPTQQFRHIPDIDIINIDILNLI